MGLHKFRTAIDNRIYRGLVSRSKTSPGRIHTGFKGVRGLIALVGSSMSGIHRIYDQDIL